jgi:hypothetical protein
MWLLSVRPPPRLSAALLLEKGSLTHMANEPDTNLDQHDSGPKSVVCPGCGQDGAIHGPMRRSAISAPALLSLQELPPPLRFLRGILSGQSCAELWNIPISSAIGKTHSRRAVVTTR